MDENNYDTESSSSEEEPVRRKPIAKKPRQNRIVRRDKEFDYDSEIIKLTKIDCSHHVSYGYGNNNLKTCNDIFQTIVDCYDAGKIPSQNALNEFMKYITTRTRAHYYYYNSDDTIKYRCIYKNSEVLSNALMMIFNNYAPGIDIIKELVKIAAYDTCYSLLNQNQNFKGLSHDDLLIIIEARLRYSRNQGVNDDTDLATFIVNNIIVNTENLLALCGCRSSHLAILIAPIIDKFSGIVTEEFMDSACAVLPYSKPIIQALINRGIKISSDHLGIVCANCNLEAIEYILQITRMPINKQHYRALVGSSIYDPEPELEYYYYRKNKPSKFKNGYSDEKMELLIKYGFKPDYDDVLFGIKNKISIPNIERFGIKLDAKILDACYDVDYYPKYNFDFIDKELIALQELCTSRRISEIKSKIKKNNLVPDRKCMENVCKFAKNSPVYEFLKSNGGKTTYKCIRNCAEFLKNNPFLLTIIDDYEKIHQAEIEKYEDNIKKLEEQVKTLGGTIQSNVQMTQKVALQKEEDDEVEEIDYKPNEKINIIGKKLKKIPKNIEIIDDDQDDNQENVKEEDKKELNIINLPVDPNKVIEIQKEYKLKSALPDKFVEIFEIKNSKKMSYTEIKQYLMNEIKTNVWFDEQNKNLIKLPDDIKEKLKLEKNGLINFSDLDKLICLILN
jgi:hypothetical protein